MNVNNTINLKIANISSTIENAKAMIEPITEENTYANKRRKRRDTGHALGSEYCDKLSSNKGDDDDDDTSMLGSIGNVVSDIFGAPTSDDIKAVASHVCNLATLADLDEKQIHTANERLTSMSQAINKRITNLKDGVTDVENRVSDLKDQFQHIVKQTDDNIDKVELRMNKLEGMVNVMIELENGLNKAEQAVDTMILTTDKWVSAINHLTSGYLPFYLVSAEDITNVLDHLHKILPDQFMIVHKNPSFYYQMRSLTYTRTDDYLMVMLTFPIYAIGGMLAVYRIDSTHLSISLNDTASTWIHGLPDFFATTLDTEYYTEFDTAHFSTCRGETLKICSSETSLKRSTQRSCAASIYYDSAEDIMKICDIRYEENMAPGHAIQIYNHQYFVHSSSLDETWQLVCPNAKTGYNEQNIDSCNSCIIEVPCFCKLLATDFIIPYQLTDCIISDPLYPKLTYHYGINLPMIHSLFNTADLSEIKGDILKENVKWNIPLPTLNVSKSSTWENVVEKDQSYVNDFFKVIAQHKKKSVGFATKADALLKKAQDFSDLSDFNLKDIENKFGGNFLFQLFNPKTIIGGVSTATIFSIIAIIISVYNCYAYRVR
jgi:hypothetical protein